MTSPSLLQRLQRSFDRDRELPAAHKVKKALRYAASSAAAPFYLIGCDQVGPGARARGRPVIANAGRIEIGARAHIGSMFVPTRLSTGPRGVLRIGDDVTINFGCSISAEQQVDLGHRVSLGPYVTISDTDEPEPAEDGASGASKPRGPAPIVIGDDVWLAARVRVTRGAVIGDGSVITAGSVVDSEIPPGVIAGGVPARVLRRIGAPAAASAAEMAPPTEKMEPPRTEPVPTTRESTKPEVATAKPEVAPSLIGCATPAAPSPAAAPAPEVNGLLVSDFSIQELALHLRAADPLGPRVDAAVAPFDQVVQTLHQLGADPAAPKPDFAVVWTRPESIAPFRELSLGQQVSLDDVLAEVDAFAARLRAAAAGVKALFVPTWVWPPYDRGLGMIDLRKGGAGLAVRRMNLRLIEALEGVSNAFVLDADRWVSGAGRPAQTSRLWFLGKVTFAADVFAAAAADIHAALRALRGGTRKVLVLDLDNTLWGGIVGDVGYENLHLGGHDPAGEAYVEFQRRIQALGRRGILLAVVSKNEESVALDAIRRHPAMVLKPDDLAAYRINWRDKAANIAEIAAELNLGLQSFVFLDDNPVERARVREALPEVYVPDWPEDELLYPQAFLSLRCFDTPAISREDLERNRMYAAERSREALKKEVGSLDDWLVSLGTKVSFARLDPANLARTTQLLNKTNQMNLSTRRLGEAELTAWAGAPGHEAWAVSVSDRFGDAGLTGILDLEVNGPTLRVVDYVLSCRVMGRRVEETMLCAAVQRARQLGANKVEAKYLPTAKNKPCLGFFKASGFDFDEPSQTFTWPVERPYPLPRSIQVTGIDLGTTQGALS
jgi:FkbH-like protein